MNFTDVDRRRRNGRALTPVHSRSVTVIARALIAGMVVVGQETIWGIQRRLISALPLMGSRRQTERGDVPGWVLITLMTAGLVVALWAIAGPMLANLFTDAVSSVKGP